MKTLDQFNNDHPLGSRVGDDTLVQDGEETEATKYQCVSYAKAFIREVGGLEPGRWGNAIKYWTATNPQILDKADQIGNGIPKGGDIAIFKTKGYSDYTQPGHIAIATGNYNVSQMEVREQNGQTGSGTGTGQDAIRLRWIDRSRLAGLVRFRPTFVPNAHKTAYAAPRSMQLNKGVNKWNVTYPDFNGVASHPVDRKEAGYKLSIVGYMNHPSGQTYLLESLTDVGGWNSKDCDDYTPPPVVVTPPRAPEIIRKADTLTLVTDLLCYPDTTKALMATSPNGELKAGTTYYIWGRDRGTVNLSTSNMHDQNQWVEERRNVVPVVVPEPPKPVVPPKIVTTIQEAAKDIPVNVPADQDKWKGSIAALRFDQETGERLPEFFWATNTSPMVIKDLDGKREAITMSPYNSDAKGTPRRLPVIATLEKDGILYAWPEQAAKSHIYYCVPMFVLKADKGGVFDAGKDWIERVVTHTMRLSDHPKLAWYRFNKWLDGIKQTEPGKDQK